MLAVVNIRFALVMMLLIAFSYFLRCLPKLKNGNAKDTFRKAQLISKEFDATIIGTHRPAIDKMILARNGKAKAMIFIIISV